MPVLSIDHVTKRYGSFTAVDDVSFNAQPGRILGLLGPNGAGKTSTIRMITYITAPDEGQVLFDGRPVGPWSQEQMGYLPEERGLYKKMKVGEQLLYLAELKGLNPTEARERIRYWLDRFGARDWTSKKTEELSKGMQQKVQFVATILHNPRLLILFASHRMEQVEQLCDDICMVSKGRLVLQGALREVKQRFGKNTVAIDFDGDPGFIAALEAQGAVRVLNRSHHHTEMRLLDGTSPRHVLETALASVDTITRFELDEPPLNEIFVQVVGESEAKPEPATV